MLTISVKNFGPIAEGSVDLKPLTIFVGPSNTGKSYMATAVYAVMRAMARAGRMTVQEGNFRETVWARLPTLSDRQISGAPLTTLIQWLRQLASLRSSTADDRMSALPLEFRFWLEEGIVLQLNYLREDVIDQLRQIRGDTSKFVKIGADPVEFSMTVGQSFPKLDLAITLSDKNRRRPKFDISQIWLPDFIFDLPLEFWQVDETNLMWRETARGFVNSVSEGLVQGLPSKSFFLPAGRSNSTISYKALASALIRQSASIGAGIESKATLPGINAEFLAQLISLERRGGSILEDIQQQKACNFIEMNVLHGRIDFDEPSDLPFPEFVYLTQTPNGLVNKFTLDQTSSMVSELAPLILFLKYLVRRGHLLILEEPESHLHPAAQRQLARGIVRLVNAGVKVLITTHSDTFITQINHLLRISYASKRWLRENDFQPEDCIAHDRVGAYQFGWAEDQSGSVIKELEVHKDIGIDEGEFIGVIDSLYEESLLVQRIRVKE